MKQWRNQLLLCPEKPLPDIVPDTENLPAPEPKTPQEVEAERQQMLARLRTELREQVCAIHADVTLPPDREQGSEATEQQLHILLYQTDVPEAELNAALSDLRAQRRREKAQYQGAPFADVFQVELILSEEDSDRACIVDVGDTGMSYVIPWSSIRRSFSSRCAAMWHRQTESSAAIAKRTSATPKTDE